MSTLKADTIQSTGGGAATLTNQSAAKCFQKFTMAGANEESFNASTLTDSSAGDFSINFINNMNTTTYTVNSNVYASADRSANCDQHTTAQVGIATWYNLSRSEDSIVSASGMVHGSLA